jgi:hypothetical protein
MRSWVCRSGCMNCSTNPVTDWRFIAIDFFGALFSLLSVVTQKKWDALGGSPYIICMCFHTTFVSLHLSWKFFGRNQSQLIVKRIDLEMAQPELDEKTRPMKKESGSHIESKNARGSISTKSAESVMQK